MKVESSSPIIIVRSDSVRVILPKVVVEIKQETGEVERFQREQPFPASKSGARRRRVMVPR